jgi:hypothetical protein
MMISQKVGIRRQRKKVQMQGAQILRNEAYIEVRCNDEGCRTTQPFGFAQGREHVERQMDFLRSRQSWVILEQIGSTDGESSGG